MTEDIFITSIVNGFFMGLKAFANGAITFINNSENGWILIALIALAIANIFVSLKRRRHS